MDRLTTGRRHARAGSLSVTELITRQAARPAPPSPVRAAATVTVSVPAGPTSHRRPPSRAATLAKMTSLGVATVMLCGAVAVASSIAHRRTTADEAAEPPAEHPAEQINGERALLPDELDRTLTPTGATAAPPPRPAPTTSAAPKPTPPAPRAGAPKEATTAADHAVPVAPVSDLDVVRQFYAHLPRDPAVAFDLISPDLLHSTLGHFLESWSLVRSVDVLDLRQQADGVLAIVRMHLADGSNLQLQQLLTVAESPRRIVGVELLSAQRN